MSFADSRTEFVRTQGVIVVCVLGDVLSLIFYIAVTDTGLLRFALNYPRRASINPRAFIHARKKLARLTP